MTAIFLEYQAQKDLKDNAQSMIGKLYYWYTNFDETEIPFRKINLMRITGISNEIDVFNRKKTIQVEYSYVDGGLTGYQELTYFLKNTKLYDEDNL